MFEQQVLTTLYLQQPFVRQQWQTLLRAEGIERLAEADYHKVDEAIGLYVADELVATAAFAGNVLQYFAIHPAYRDEGRTFNRLVTELLRRLAERQIFHVFVVTKPSYEKSFAYNGFRTIAVTDEGVVLEKGDQSVQTYVAQLPRKPGAKVASIVMNANPFTRGHLSLVATAAAENDVVYVFVLATDQAMFRSAERLTLVREGTKHLDNVVVCSGAEYVISASTFPTYFLRKTSEQTMFQTEIDAALFKQSIAPALQVTKRYVGEEPYSEMTATYNQALRRVLAPEIDVVIVPRAQTATGEIISATKVRKAYLAGDIATIDAMTPPTTAQFLRTKMTKEKEV